MAFLAMLAAVTMLPGVSSASADGLLDRVPVDGLELGTLAAAGDSDSYSWGLTGRALFENFDRPNNRSGSLGFSYANQLVPLDPFETELTHRHIESWVGGVEVKPWEKSALGLEFDSVSDESFFIFSNGLRTYANYGPLGISYRFAKTRLESEFEVIRLTEDDIEFIGFRGAVAYQHRLQMHGTLKLGQKDEIYGAVARSFFRPNLNEFVELIDLAILFPLLEMQNSVQNFEAWRGDLSWGRFWSDRLDTTLTFGYTRLVFDTGPIFDIGVGAGYSFLPWLRGDVMIDHSRSGPFKQSLVTLGVRVSWWRE